MADEDRSEEQELEAAEKHTARAAAKVEKAAEKGYVRGGPDGPQDIEGVLRRRTAKPEQTWKRGDDPEAANLALATASVGTTGGPFAGGYNHAAQALADPVSEEDRIAGQHRHHEKTSKSVPEKEAKAKADEDAKAKAEAAESAMKGDEGSQGSAEGGAKEAKDAPAGTGDTSPTPD